MAARAQKMLQNALIRDYVVEAGQTAVIGKPVQFGTTDGTVQDTGGASDLMIGIVKGPNADDPGTGIIPAGKHVEVVLLFATVCPMIVGTGNSTRGKKQVSVASGITDAAANGGGTTAVSVVGVAMQSGVAGDLIGVGLTGGNRVSP
jgi:hypothetical protein